MRGLCLALAILAAAAMLFAQTQEVNGQIFYGPVVCPPAPAVMMMAPMPVLEPSTTEVPQAATVATAPVVWRSAPVAFATRGAARRFYRRAALGIPQVPVVTTIPPARVSRGVYLVPAW